MNEYYCVSCRKDRRHNIFADVTVLTGDVLQVLASCVTCNKGRWIEVTDEKFKELQEQYEKRK